MSIRAGVTIIIARGKEIHANKVHGADGCLYVCALLPPSIR